MDRASPWLPILSVTALAVVPRQAKAIHIAAERGVDFRFITGSSF